MAGQITLQVFLSQIAAETPDRTQVASVVRSLATMAQELSELISLGPLAGDLASGCGDQNYGGDLKRNLDVIANERLIEAVRDTPVSFLASEELDTPIVLDPDGDIALAIDPLDGSSNIETNAPIGTIFSILPRGSFGQEDVFLQPGAAQIAAGFVVYGAQTSLVLTLGQGVKVFILDRKSRDFVLATETITIPPEASEYAINASNYRHWDEPVRAYIDDCVQGADGPRGKDFNMRWIASLVAEAYRILVRGGIFLYPRDQRPGYCEGRLRLVYEANPIAFVIEQAGGAATNGVQRILDIAPDALHQRTPLVFGSTMKVDSVVRYHTDPNSSAERSPLFGRRGLLRA